MFIIIIIIIIAHKTCSVEKFKRSRCLARQCYVNLLHDLVCIS